MCIYLFSVPKIVFWIFRQIVIEFAQNKYKIESRMVDVIANYALKISTL